MVVESGDRPGIAYVSSGPCPSQIEPVSSVLGPHELFVFFETAVL